MQNMVAEEIVEWYTRQKTSAEFKCANDFCVSLGTLDGLVALGEGA